jgi:hypothetical protein
MERSGNKELKSFYTCFIIIFSFKSILLAFLSFQYSELNNISNFVKELVISSFSLEIQGSPYIWPYVKVK